MKSGDYGKNIFGTTSQAISNSASGGGASNGNLNMQGYAINNLANGVNPSDAVNLSQLDSYIPSTVNYGSITNFPNTGSNYYINSSGNATQPNFNQISGSVLLSQLDTTKAKSGYYIRGSGSSWTSQQITLSDLPLGANSTILTTNSSGVLSWAQLSADLVPANTLTIAMTANLQSNLDFLKMSLQMLQNYFNVGKLYLANLTGPTTGNYILGSDSSGNIQWQLIGDANVNTISISKITGLGSRLNTDETNISTLQSYFTNNQLNLANLTPGTSGQVLVSTSTTPMWTNLTYSSLTQSGNPIGVLQSNGSSTAFSKLILTNITPASFTPSNNGVAQIINCDQNGNVSWQYLTNSNIQDGTIGETKITNLNSDLTTIRSNITTNSTNITTLQSYFTNNQLNLANLTPGSSGQFLYTNSTPAITWRTISSSDVLGSPSAAYQAFIASSTSPYTPSWQLIPYSSITSGGASAKYVLYNTGSSWVPKQLSYSDIARVGTALANYTSAGFLLSDGTNIGYSTITSTNASTYIASGSLPTVTLSDYVTQIPATISLDKFAPAAALNMLNYKIINLATPSSAQDAVNLKYLSIFLSGNVNNTSTVATAVGSAATVLTWDNTNSVFRWAQINSSNISSINYSSITTYPSSDSANAYLYFLTGNGFVKSLGTPAAYSVFYQGSTATSNPSWATINTNSSGSPGPFYPGVFGNDYQGNIKFYASSTYTTSIPVITANGVNFMDANEGQDYYISANGGNNYNVARVQGLYGKLAINSNGYRIYPSTGASADHIILQNWGTSSVPSSSSVDYNRGGLGPGSSSPETYSAPSANSLELFVASSSTAASRVTYFDSSGNKALSSDMNLKSNITYYDNNGDYLKQIKKLKPCKFAYNDPHECLNTRTRNGLIAQDLETDMPEICSHIHNGKSNCADKKNCHVCSDEEFMLVESDDIITSEEVVDGKKVSIQKKKMVWKSKGIKKQKAIYPEELIFTLIGAVQDLIIENSKLKEKLDSNNSTLNIIKTMLGIK